MDTYIDNEIDNLREGLRLGYSAPRVTVEAVPAQVSNSVKMPAVKPSIKVFSEFMGGSLLDPVLSVTKRDDAAELSERPTAVLAEVVEVRLRRF